jgi:hypothetical protein
MHLCRPSPHRVHGVNGALPTLAARDHPAPGIGNMNVDKLDPAFESEVRDCRAMLAPLETRRNSGGSETSRQ